MFRFEFRDLLVKVTIVALSSLLILDVEAPDPYKSKRAGHSKYGAMSSRTRPYNVGDRRRENSHDDDRYSSSRRHGDRTSGAASQRTRALDPQLSNIQYPPS